MTRITAQDDGPIVLLHDEQDGMRIQFDLERGIRFVVLGEAVNIGWRRIVNSDSSHEIVKMIEFATGLQAPGVTPNTTPRALVYRLISSFLTSVVNDPNEWNVVLAPMAIDGTNEPSAGQFLRMFPSTRAAVARYTALTQTRLFNGGTRLFHQPFWALIRDLEPVAILDTAGVIHTREGAVPLMPIFTESGGRMSTTTAFVLGKFQP
ncbi:hypothetical protein GY21_05535 [Cryobacterium roopkundense]|uniref:T3SS peptide-binding chaperone domain-containing protein n=2 Tax=Cryobacterium roopkundense TaxID=1001240 RepID=A0A099JMA5_9MICO|nr:hypothetical protein [Cryobacterium roopkundense]KGJ79260.1 hypothetical protein GY21_05535 [Cryobacterium roopkundense]MBB5643698.1 hypothetical protein [Cryobacterium roopkundense]